MFDLFVNLFEKNAPPGNPEMYADKVYVINRWLANEPAFTEIVAQLTKYMPVLGGRYYHLLYALIPRSRFYIKYPKKDKLDEYERAVVRAVQRVFCCNGREAYITKQILEKDGIDVERLLGLNIKGGKDGREVPVDETDTNRTADAPRGIAGGKEQAVQRLRDTDLAVRSKKKSRNKKVHA
jgi:hypothetical protein